MRGRSGRRGAWLLSEKAERGQGRPALFCCRKKFCTNFKKMLTDVIFPDIINIVLMRSIRNGKVRYAAVAHLVERHLAKVEVASSSLVSRSTFSSQNHICGCSSSGRAPPCQGGGSEFEPRQPLQRKGTELIGAFVFYTKRTRCLHLRSIRGRGPRESVAFAGCDSEFEPRQPLQKTRHRILSRCFLFYPWGF